MLLGLAAAIASALLYGAPAALQARASRRIPRGSLWRQFAGAARDRLMQIVLLCYLAGALCHYVAILLLPLYLAQAAVAASVIFTALAGVWLLGERLTRLQWLGLALLTGGIVVLALAAGRVGRSHLDETFTAWLLAGAVLLAGLGYAAGRWRGGRGGSLLGLLSGLAYGGVPLAVRALGVAAPDVHTVLTGLVAGLLGLIGFWLYSLALARAQVNAATAPLILAQTTVPALLGIWLLDDQVRAGWWPELVLGLAASMLGAAALARAETLTDLPVTTSDASARLG